MDRLIVQMFQNENAFTPIIINETPTKLKLYCQTNANRRRFFANEKKQKQFTTDIQIGTA